ncbi:hypothetical protein F2P81_017651 [Scophthalmus maximus]|uniref:Uncharacterized protein n=1 Tax=Scophthalmus maximus TaxID=52904 RepID=A0A6A4SGA6_SCOMX|nr:hypothetical protein F2P81_017651 [Scophthalmus maximus]
MTRVRTDISSTLVTSLVSHKDDCRASIILSINLLTSCYVTSFSCKRNQNQRPNRPSGLSDCPVVMGPTNVPRHETSHLQTRVRCGGNIFSVSLVIVVLAEQQLAAADERPITRRRVRTSSSPLVTRRFVVRTSPVETVCWSPTFTCDIRPPGVDGVEWKEDFTCRDQGSSPEG